MQRSWHVIFARMHKCTSSLVLTEYSCRNHFHCAGVDGISKIDVELTFASLRNQRDPSVVEI